MQWKSSRSLHKILQYLLVALGVKPEILNLDDKALSTGPCLSLPPAPSQSLSYFPRVTQHSCPFLRSPSLPSPMELCIYVSRFLDNSFPTPNKWLFILHFQFKRYFLCESLGDLPQTTGLPHHFLLAQLFPSIFPHTFIKIVI